MGDTTRQAPLERHGQKLLLDRSRLGLAFRHVQVRTILVTGGCRLFGVAIVNTLADAGHDVIAVDWNTGLATMQGSFMQTLRTHVHWLSTAMEWIRSNTAHEQTGRLACLDKIQWT